MVNSTVEPHNARMTTVFQKSVLLFIALVLAGCVGDPTPESVTAMVTPAATGSMGPNLATGSDGTVVLSWIEPDGDGHALRFSVLAEAGWEAPRTVARGDTWFVNWADFPSVVPLSDSLWGAHWLDSQPEGGYAYDVKVSLSNDHGDTWSEAFLPHFDGTPTEHGFVTLFPDSNGLGLVWLDGRKMVNDYDEHDVGASGMTLRAATFGVDQVPIRSSLVDGLTCDCCQTDVALTTDGPVAVYRDRTTAEIRDIYVSRREFGEWQSGIPVARDDWEIAACPVNGPIIRSIDDKLVVAWFTAAAGQSMVKAAWSGDGGKHFADPIVISSDVPLGHVGAVLLPGGDLIVGWQKKIGEGRAELLLRRVSPSGDLSDAYALTEASDIFAFSVPQLALADAGIIVVWTTSVDDVYGVRSAVVPLSVIN
jgi:hypothetical protein